ncbi:MAG: tRNA 5-methylaminomethyl-2-thiouridine biosynthesis bifunctional protein [Rhodobacteraceae bacterium HLUCCO18]|nr:MAG: tRNA 5-methylaminomethyl-2-thiouridine biosynthesis bifunctional protein [Rhodobacteraceae bacterium HLUCCO18]
MFETLSMTLGLDIGPRAVSVWLGLALGIAFGALAFLTRFCLRRALVGPAPERAPARGVWALALAVAILGTQIAVAAGWVDFAAHRFHAASLPLVLIVAGGLLFGAGAVLARGCITRLTVLTGGGNLRALTGLLVFAVTAHATLQGLLMPLRTSLGALTVTPPAVSLGDLPGGPWVWSGLLVAALLLVALRSGAGRGALFGAAALGALVPAAWVATGFVLFDEFDPIALEGLSFTAPWAETLFWSMAASLTAPGFGTGLNFLATLQAWRAARIPGTLRFTSFEAYPMPLADLQRALSVYPDLPAEVLTGTGTVAPHLPGPDFDLTIVEGDARQSLAQWQGLADAWYLDGFSPAKNPELWQADLLERVGAHTAPGGSFATYTAAGDVRRALQTAGFAVERVPGYGRKRHMSRGWRA